MKKFVVTPILMGMFSLSIPQANAKVSGYGVNGDSNCYVWNNEENKKDTLKAHSNQFYGAFVLEILSTLAEGFNIMTMGETSAELIQKAGLASAALHSIKIVSSIGELMIMPSILNGGKSLHASRVVYTAPFIDLYFLLKDKRKIECSKGLATFYKHHKKHVRKVKNKQVTQAILLAISALARMYTYLSYAQEFSKGAEVKGTDFQPSIKLHLILPCIIETCGVFDFFRKRNRYNAELSEYFEDWLLDHDIENDESDKDDEEIVKQSQRKKSQRKKTSKKVKAQEAAAVADEESNSANVEDNPSVNPAE